MKNKNWWYAKRPLSVEFNLTRIRTLASPSSKNGGKINNWLRLFTDLRWLKLANKISAHITQLPQPRQDASDNVNDKPEVWESKFPFRIGALKNQHFYWLKAKNTAHKKLFFSLFSMAATTTKKRNKTKLKTFEIYIFSYIYFWLQSTNYARFETSIDNENMKEKNGLNK